MPKLEQVNSFAELGKGLDRTRRNLFKAGLKLGAVGGAALVAGLTGVRTAAAGEHEKEWRFPFFKWHHHHHKKWDEGGQGGHHCFMTGTMIRTTAGYRRIESLSVGDLVPTMFAGEQPIQWIGRYKFRRSDWTRPWNKDFRPVRIARSALGPDIPRTDLLVTQAHALYFDGVLVPAGCLVNGRTITLDAAAEHRELEFYHIKLANHDVIDAEGAPCESLLEVGEDAANFADYFRKIGTPASEPKPCVPIEAYRGGRDEIKSRLRSALSPWIDLRKRIDIVRDRLEEQAIHS
jgi:hypothetical protein